MNALQSSILEWGYKVADFDPIEAFSDVFSTCKTLEFHTLGANINTA